MVTSRIQEILSCYREENRKKTGYFKGLKNAKWMILHCGMYFHLFQTFVANLLRQTL
jgi:hypothetical protein